MTFGGRFSTKETWFSPEMAETLKCLLVLLMGRMKFLTRHLEDFLFLNVQTIIESYIESILYLLKKIFLWAANKRSSDIVYYFLILDCTFVENVVIVRENNSKNIIRVFQCVLQSRIHWQFEELPLKGLYWSMSSKLFRFQFYPCLGSSVGLSFGSAHNSACVHRQLCFFFRHCIFVDESSLMSFKVNGVDTG